MTEGCGKHGLSRKYDGNCVTGAVAVDAVTAAERQDIVNNVTCACISVGTDDTNSIDGADGTDPTDSADGADNADCLDGAYSVACSDGAGGEDGADSLKYLYSADSGGDSEIADCADDGQNDKNKSSVPCGQSRWRRPCKRFRRHRRRTRRKFRG